MYKRFVIYLYYYKNGEKKENCGYAKINIQNEECRIEVNIKNISQMRGNQVVYLLTKEDDNWKRREITDAKINEGTMNLKYTGRYHEEEEELSADKVQGMLIYDGENILKAVCGCLKEEEVHIFEIAETGNDKKEEEERKDKEEENEKKEKEEKEKKQKEDEKGKQDKKEKEDKKENQDKIKEEEKVEEEEKTQKKDKKKKEDKKENEKESKRAENKKDREDKEKNKKVENMKAAEEKLETAELMQTGKIQHQKIPNIVSEESENSVYEYDEECLKRKAENRGADCIKELEIEGCSMNLNDKENVHTVSSDTWQEKMFRVFPKVIVSINGETTSGIKLKPHDIVWFPGVYWRLASNRFLLNGYYNYRYILFFKGKGEYEGRYFLGTPGFFSVNDAITAKKFGFTDFFTEGDKKEEDRVYARNEGKNFGFWCRET